MRRDSDKEIPPSDRSRRVVATARPAIERLEGRTLLSNPTDAEQYILEMINRARAYPDGEVARLSAMTWGDPNAAPQTPSLNEGLAAGTISSTPKQPLAFNPILLNTSTSHSQYMIGTGSFSHYENPENVDPFTRMTNAGYDWSWAGENIAAASIYNNPAPSEVSSTSEQLEDDLFVDGTEPGRGHRVNLMTDSFKEVGVGITNGLSTMFGSPAQSILAMTQDFGVSSSNTESLHTGVVFNDRAGTRFYASGEGLGGATITAIDPNGIRYTTTTWSTGGYSLQLPPGVYTVTPSGGGLAAAAPIGVLGNAASTTVSITSQNVELDFATGATVTPTPTPISTPTPTLTPTPSPTPTPTPTSPPTLASPGSTLVPTPGSTPGPVPTRTPLEQAQQTFSSDQATLAADLSSMSQTLAADAATAGAANGADASSVAADRAKMLADKATSSKLTLDRQLLAGDRLRQRTDFARARKRSHDDRAGYLALIKADRSRIQSDLKTLRAGAKASGQ